MKITINEIAKLTNANISTVSRVLSNKPGVGEKRRKEILEVAEKLGYQKNRIA